MLVNIALASRWLSFLLLFALWPLSCWSSQNTPIEIAAVMALSGKAEAYGRAALQGAQLAVDEINADGGLLLRPLVLTALDSQSKPLLAKLSAVKAVKRGVAGVVGDLWSTHSLAIAPVLQKAGVPMITPGSTAPAVTQVGSYIFRVCYTDDFQGELMADFAFQALGHRKAAVLTNISETYSQKLANFFVRNFIQSGGQVIYQGGYKGSAVDFRDLLSPLKSIHPQVIFIPGYSRDSGLLIKQAYAMGIRATYLGGDAWEKTIHEFAGEALEGSYFSTHWHPGVPYARSRIFIARFRQAFGDEEISPFAALAYDAVRVFADAIKRAGVLDHARIRDALAGTRQFAGATGPITFDQNGDPIKKGASILKFHNGHWQFYKAFEPK